MVLLIIIPMKNGYFIGNINPTFSDKPMLETSSIIMKFPETSGAPGSRVSARSTGSGSMDHARVARIGEPVEARASAAGLQLKTGKMLR